MNIQQQYDEQGRLLLPLMWENSRGFEGGASKKDIFLHGAAMAGYTNAEADAFVAGLSSALKQNSSPAGINAVISEKSFNKFVY